MLYMIRLRCDCDVSSAREILASEEDPTQLLSSSHDRFTGLAGRMESIFMESPPRVELWKQFFVAPPSVRRRVVMPYSSVSVVRVCVSVSMAGCADRRTRTGGMNDEVGNR